MNKIIKRIALPLMIWGAINMLSGILYFFPLSELIRGIVFQAFLWGLIDFIIGLVAFLRKKEFKLEKINKILLINSWLDVGYILIGLILIFVGGGVLFIIGNGIGIIIQGLFLLIVDVLHYRYTKKKTM